jgi:hypothetical protein
MRCLNTSLHTGSLLMKTLLSQRWAFAVAFVLPTLLLAVSPADAAVVLSNINQTWGNGYGFTPPAQIGLGIKQHSFCNSGFSEVGHLASMVR